jgi:Fe2+ transport system protein B
VNLVVLSAVVSVDAKVENWVGAMVEKMEAKLVVLSVEMRVVDSVEL